MTTPRIIGLVGPKGSGKSTLARLLEKEMGYRRTSFASPIKAMLTTLLGLQHVNPELIERMLNGDLKEVKTPFLAGCSPRRAMQTLGTEWRDTLRRDLWTKIWETRVARMVLLSVDDVRFTHEAK